MPEKDYIAVCLHEKPHLLFLQAEVEMLDIYSLKKLLILAKEEIVNQQKLNENANLSEKCLRREIELTEKAIEQHQEAFILASSQEDAWKAKGAIDDLKSRLGSLKNREVSKKPDLTTLQWLISQLPEIIREKL